AVSEAAAGALTVHRAGDAEQADAEAAAGAAGVDDLAGGDGVPGDHPVGLVLGPAAARAAGRGVRSVCSVLCRVGVHEPSLPGVDLSRPSQLFAHHCVAWPTCSTSAGSRCSARWPSTAPSPPRPGPCT